MSTQKIKKLIQVFCRETRRALLPGSPPGNGSVTNNCSGCISPEIDHPGPILTRTIYRVVRPGESRSRLIQPDSDDSVRVKEKPADNPNNFSASRLPRSRQTPTHRPDLGRCGGLPDPTRQASRFPLRFFDIVDYIYLFGFCGIFCGCYVNHAIFSTIHEFL